MPHNPAAFYSITSQGPKARPDLSQEERVVSDLVCGEGMTVVAACAHLSMTQEHLAAVLAAALDKMAEACGLSTSASVPGLGFMPIRPGA